MYDKKHELLHMNPGAIGDYGIHKVKTIHWFTIEGKEIKDIRVEKGVNFEKLYNEKKKS